jgi:hypothetical protein
MDINWIIKGVIISGGGWIMIEGLIKLINNDLENKCGSLGYKLYNLKISWRAAYSDCLFTVIKWPLTIIGVATALAGYSKNHIWDTLIVTIVITIPITFSQIMPFLRRVEKEAEKSYGDI